MRAFITGLSGAILTAAERHFIQEADPWGLILFKRRNYEGALEQVLAKLKAR